MGLGNMRVSKELSFRKVPLALPAIKQVATPQAVHFFRHWSGDFSFDSWVSDFELFLDQTADVQDRTRVTHLGIKLNYPAEERYYELRLSLETWLKSRLLQDKQGVVVEWSCLFKKEGLFYFFSLGHGGLWGLRDGKGQLLWTHSHFLWLPYQLPRVAVGLADASQGVLLCLSAAIWSQLAWQVGTGSCASVDWQQGVDSFFSAQVAHSDSPYFYICHIDLTQD